MQYCLFQRTLLNLNPAGKKVNEAHRCHHRHCRRVVVLIIIIIIILWVEIGFNVRLRLLHSYQPPVEHHPL